MPFSLYLYNRPAVTLDGDHHHPQMTGVHPPVVSRANPAAAVVSQGRVAQAQVTGVHQAHQMTGVQVDLPRARVERADVVN